MANQTINYPSYGHRRWKAPVLFADLPVLGNHVGDTRLVTDLGAIYFWDGSAWLTTISATAGVITVGSAGAQYTSIQNAIDAVYAGATATNQFLIEIAFDVYNEDLTLYPFVNLKGKSGAFGSPIITGKVTGTFTNPSEIVVLENLQFIRTVASDGEVLIDIEGGLACSDLFIQGNIADDYGFTAIKCNATTSYFANILSFININSTYDGSTKDLIGIHALGTGQYSQTSSNTQITAKASSGTIITRKLESTDGFLCNNNVMYIDITKAFTGTAVGCLVTSIASVGQIRISQGEQWKNTGISGGTSIGLKLDNGTGARMEYVGGVFFSNGFTNEYICSTALNDTQEVWLNSVNKDMGITGTGLAIVTPYHEAKSGFVAWSQDPGITDYWKFGVADGLSALEFKVTKRCVGVVKGALVTVPKDQIVTLTDDATNYIYATSEGVLTTTVTPINPNLNNIISLFEVFVSNTTDKIVCKENHPYEFTSSIAKSWHSLFGSLLEDSDQTLAINSGANRTANLVGTNVINDHGVSTSISAQTPVTWIQLVQNTSSGLTYIKATQSGIISVISDTNDTGTNGTSGKYINYRVGVLKESLNSSDPQFICIASTVNHANATAAANAIAAGAVIAFPTDIKKLEICQLGFLMVQADGAGGGTLAAVTTELQVSGAKFISGGTSNSAGLIVTDTTSFVNILSATDTNVQTALNTIDTKSVSTNTVSTLVKRDSSGEFATTRIKFDDGTAALPTLTFASDLDTGLFSKTINSLGFAAAGAEVGNYSATGAWAFPVNTIHTVGNGTAADNTVLSLVSNYAANASYMKFVGGSTQYGYLGAGKAGQLISTGTSDNDFCLVGKQAIRFSANDGAATHGSLSSTGDWELGKAGATHSLVGVTGFSDGAVGTPSITFTADLDTGFFRVGTNNFAAVTNGAKMIDIGPATLGFFGTTAVSRPVVADPSAVTTTETSGADYTSNEQDMLTHLKTDVTNLRATVLALTDALQALGLVSPT